MAKIKRAAFSVSWTTLYESILDGSVPGRLASRDGYLKQFHASGADVGAAAAAPTLPWYRGPDKEAWSHFWANYMGTPKQLRKTSGDSAWEHVIPVRSPSVAIVAGPPGTEPTVDVWIYPCAISVLVHVKVDGDWAVDQLANVLMALRGDQQWELQTSQTTSSNRHLDGIAGALRDEAVALLAASPVRDPEGPPTVLSVAAPLVADAVAADLDLGDKTVSSCLVGLSVLGPPGQL